MQPENTWRTFSAAPHRMFFFGGAVQALLIMIWWLIDIGGRFDGLYNPITWTMPPTDAHAFLMIYGFFPFFIFGFLMTTYPKWMNGEEVERSTYVPAFVLLCAGILLFYLGLVISYSLTRIALLVLLTGWTVGLYALLRVYLRARHPDKRHATITSIVLGLGWLLVAGFGSDEAHLVALAKTGGIWLLLLPVFFAVSHRMIPFFSANVIPGYKVVRPDWALGMVPACALLHSVLEMDALQQWTWIVDLPMAACALYLTTSWRIRESLALPILGMLHISFAWLSIALLLYAVQSLTLFTTGMLVLAKAPLHALTIGYFTSMMLAMVTRVTLGHSGRRLVADGLTWAIFLVFQFVVALRVIAEIPQISFTAHGHILMCTAILWLVCFGIWGWKYSPIYWRPRPDGNPG